LKRVIPASNSVINHVWLAAGYKTFQVDPEAEKLVFVRDRADTAKSHPARRRPDPQRAGSDRPWREVD